MSEQKFWRGLVKSIDDFGCPITDEFIDGKTQRGPWAIMSLVSWEAHGFYRLGVGFGQKYKKQDNGRWLKIEG